MHEVLLVFSLRRSLLVRNPFQGVNLYGLIRRGGDPTQGSEWRLGGEKRIVFFDLLTTRAKFRPG